MRILRMGVRIITGQLKTKEVILLIAKVIAENIETKEKIELLVFIDTVSKIFCIKNNITEKLKLEAVFTEVFNITIIGEKRYEAQEFP